MQSVSPVLFELYERQIHWASEQAMELQAYFASKGRIGLIEAAWPVVPVDGVASLEDRLAA